MMFDLVQVIKVGYRYLISNKKFEIHLTKIASKQIVFKSERLLIFGIPLLSYISIALC